MIQARLTSLGARQVWAFINNIQGRCPYPLRGAALWWCTCTKKCQNWESGPPCYCGSRWWQSREECARRGHKGGKLWWPLSFSPSSTDISAIKQVVCPIRKHACILYILIYSPDINLQIFSMLGEQQNKLSLLSIILYASAQCGLGENKG